MVQRLLIVAAEFPPVKGIGRLRPLKFCQHLAALGWETAVLTPAIGDIEPVDMATLLEIPPATAVFRVPIPKPKENLVRRLKSLLGRSRQTEAPSREVAKSPVGLPKVIPARSGSLLGDLLGWSDSFARRNLLIPDDIVLWRWPAIRAGREAVKSFKPNVILATAPHFTNFLVGAGLAKAAGLPWIADYRDLWTGDVLRAWVPPWRQRLELAMERSVLATASAIVTVSDPKSEVVRARLPADSACRVITLTNGYDAEEFESVTPEKRDDNVFRIVYAGRLFKNRRGYELVEAIGALLAERHELRDRLRVEYYGGMSPEIAARMAQLVEQHELHGVVEFHPDVSYQRSKSLQKGADALLLIVDSGETTSGVIPGKLFEYIAARRPILCIAAPGATTEIISAGNLGAVVAPSDTVGLKKALATMLAHSGSEFSPDTAYLQQFERAKIVGHLAGLLNQVATGRPAS